MINPFYLDLTDREISDIQDRLGEILRGGNLILGKYTHEFEREFAGYIGSKYAVSLHSRTSAREVLLAIKGSKIARSRFQPIRILQVWRRFYGPAAHRCI